MQRVRRVFRTAMNEHFVETLVLAALVIISLMITIHFITYKPERFTGFGLLNSSREAGPFPANFSCDASLQLYTTISNHEGTTQHYKIDVTLGDASTTVEPLLGVMGGASLGRFEGIVAEQQDWEEPIILRFNETLVGDNKKIFFELFLYNTTTSSFTFTGQVLHLWIDIFGP
jgi:uncharacterized membrane protein